MTSPHMRLDSYRSLPGSMLCRVLLAASLVLMLTPPLHAQTERPLRAFQGLFGGNETNQQRPQALDLTVSLGAGYDDNVTADTSLGQGLGNPAYLKNGYLATGQIGLSYVRTGRSRSFRASSSTGLRYVPQVERRVTADELVQLAFSSPLGRRTTLQVSQSLSYQPYFSFSAVPIFLPEVGASLPIATVDYGITRVNSYWSQSAANLTRRVTRRSQLSLDYNFRYANFSDARYEDLKTHRFGAGFSWSLNRQTALRASYSYDHGQTSFLSADIRPSTFQTLEFAIDHRRPLSKTRQMALSVGSGASAVDTPEWVALEMARFYRVTAFASARVDLAKSWALWADYRTGPQFVPGFRGPFYSHVAGISVGGYLSRRVDVSGSVRLSTGEMGFARGNGYNTYVGSGQVRVAIARNVAAYANYFYYRYKYDQTVVLPSGYLRQFDRQGVRVGLTFWAPLVR